MYIVYTFFYYSNVSLKLILCRGFCLNVTISLLSWAIYLQETHSSLQYESEWLEQWESKILFSHGESNARGVAILISKQLDVKLMRSREILMVDLFS